MADSFQNRLWSDRRRTCVIAVVFVVALIEFAPVIARMTPGFASWWRLPELSMAKESQSTQAAAAARASRTARQESRTGNSAIEYSALPRDSANDLAAAAANYRPLSTRAVPSMVAPPQELPGNNSLNRPVSSSENFGGTTRSLNGYEKAERIRALRNSRRDQSLQAQRDGRLDSTALSGSPRRQPSAQYAFQSDGRPGTQRMPEASAPGRSYAFARDTSVAPTAVDGDEGAPSLQRRPPTPVPNVGPVTEVPQPKGTLGRPGAASAASAASADDADGPSSASASPSESFSDRQADSPSNSEAQRGDVKDRAAAPQARRSPPAGGDTTRGNQGHEQFGPRGGGGTQ